MCVSLICCVNALLLFTILLLLLSTVVLGPSNRALLQPQGHSSPSASPSSADKKNSRVSAAVSAHTESISLAAAYFGIFSFSVVHTFTEVPQFHSIHPCF